MKRRIAIVTLALVAGIAALALVVHLPFVRASVLRYALAYVQEQYAIRLDASRLDYNLAALRIGLADLRVSALAPEHEPFFQADYVSVMLPGSALFGVVSFEEITVADGRVFVLRRRDGTTNLPESTDTPTGDPPPLRIGRLSAPGLLIQVRDEQSDFLLDIPAVGVELTPGDGRVALGAPATVRIADRTTRISQLDGGATFDGRALHFTGTRLTTDEGSLQVDGSLLLIARDPALDLTMKGAADLATLARWGLPDDDLPEGAVAFDGRVTGALSDPEAEVRVATTRAVWQGLVITDASGDGRVTSAAADVRRLDFGFEGGRVTSSALLPFESGATARLAASWMGIDAARLVRAVAPSSTVLPSGTASGDLTAQGPLSDVRRWTASGRLHAEPGGNARGRISIVGDARFGLADGEWRVDAAHVLGGAAQLRASMSGRVTGGPEGRPLQGTGIQGTVQLRETDLSRLLNVLRVTNLAAVPTDAVSGGTLAADIRLSGTIAQPAIEGAGRVRGLAGEQIDAAEIDVEIAGRPLAPDLRFTLISPRAVVTGQELTDVRATGRLSGNTLVVDELSARQPASSGSIAGTVRYTPGSGEYTASIAGSEWQLVPTPKQPIAGRVNLRFSGTGTVAEPRGTAEIAVRGAMYQGWSFGDLEAVAELDGRAANIQARAPDFQTRANASVGLTAPYDAVVDVHAEQVDLTRLLQGVETPTPVTGTVTLVAHGEGPLETWRSAAATVEIAALEARAGDLPIRLVQPGRLRYAGERIYVDLFEAAAGETRISASGELPAFDAADSEAALLVTVTGDVDEVARAVAATGITRVPVTGGDGPVALLARVTGSIATPVIAADLEAGPGSVTFENFPPVSDLRVRAHVEGGVVELREAGATFQGAMLTATGTAPLSIVRRAGSAQRTRLGDVRRAGAAEPTRQLELHARATNITPAVAAPFVDASTLEQLKGSIDATLDLTSPTLELADVAGELRLDRMELRVADLPVTQRTTTRIVARDGFARIESWDWMGQGATLGVRGQVRLSDRQAGILANGELDLRMLTPFVRAAGITTAGRMEPRLSITGALDSPRIDGDILVTGGEARLADPRVLVSDLSARAVLTGNGARIVSLTGTVNGGPLTGDGGVELVAGRLDAQLSTDIRGMALEFPQGLRSEIDAALTLSMATNVGADLQVGPSAGPSGRVSGTVTVVRGAYREPLAVVTGLLATLRTRRLAAAVDPSPTLEGLALDVRLITDEDVIVDNNYGRFQLGADLRVIGTAASPAIAGRAELREGGQLFVGRNIYTINSGTIDFANPVTIEPDLNVVATTRTGGEEIEVTITGTPENVSVDLRSTLNPDLGQAELASLLLTGRRFEDLAPGDAAFLGTQVLGNFSAEVLGFASQAVGLDTLRLGGVDNAAVRRDPTSVATELDPTTRLTFGKSLGPNVDITLSQSLRDGDAQTWIVEYLPARRLELRLVSDDEDLRTYGFRQDLSFGGGAPRPIASAGESQRTRDVRVSAISVTGALALPETRVRDELRLEEGDRFDFGEWQEDRDRVEELYHQQGYLTVRVNATRTEVPDLSAEALAQADGNGIELTYEIAAGPRTSVVVSGVDLNGSVRARLEEAWSQSVFDDFLIEEAISIVRETLAGDGYLQPKVDARIVTEGDLRTLNVNVDAGPRSTRTVVRIEGADETLRRQVEEWLTTSDLRDRAVTDPGELERGVTAYLRSYGYLRARVTAGAPLFDASSAVVPLTVDAGPAFTIASLAFEGAEALTAERLRETAGLAEGAPYDPAAAERARDRLVAVYRAEGFPSPAVTIEQAIGEETPLVDLTFAIAPGVRQVVGEIVVSGNRETDTDVIVRALELRLNEPLRAEDSVQARRRVFDTGLFRRVDLSSERLESAAQNADTAPMRVRVTVEEWPALRLRYGVQVAEERPEDDVNGRDLVPGLSADLTRRTLFGRAIAVGGAVEWQRRERLGRLFLNTPTLFGWPIESSLVLERSREEFVEDTLVADRSGISWEQRTRVAGNVSLSYSYRFDRDHTVNTQAPLDPTVPIFDVTVNIARLTGSAARDTRDDPSDTTIGSLLSSSFEFAPEAAGSEFRFIRQLSQVYYFRPWRGVVFASAGRFGIVRPLGGQELIPSERFFAGGARTVRGVAEDGLGERDFLGFPVGGEALLVFNQEVRVPIYRWVRGVGFVDVGNVFARAGDIRLGDLVGSVGFGLRLATPFALLRADFARPFGGGPLERSGRWSFGIGHAF